MLIDTHVHLQSPAYTEDLDAVLQRAAASGLEACIVAGTDLDDSQAAVTLAETYTDVPCSLYAAVGIHPTNAHKLTPSALKTLQALAQHPRVVAIGEIGLDYYWPRITDRDWHCAEPAEQREALQAQLDLAAELDLPVIIHDRDAHKDTLEILSNWIKAHPGSTGTLHAYAGGLKHLDKVLELGFMIGMDGPVTYPKAFGLQKVAQRVPLNRLILETDGPYLTPVPHRGKRNEPAYLTHIARTIAELRDLPLDSLAKATTQNAYTLFKIDAHQ